MKFNLKQSLEKLSERVDERDLRKRNKYANLETPDHLLDIPIIGGCLYIGSRIRSALYWRTLLNNRYNQRIQLKEDLRKKKVIYSTIRDTVDKAIEKDSVASVTIKEIYLGYFMDVMTKDFPNVEVLQDTNESSKFTLITRRSDQI